MAPDDKDRRNTKRFRAYRETGNFRAYQDKPGEGKSMSSVGEESPEQTRLRYLEEMVAEHKVRLENGQHTFADIKADISKQFGEIKQDIGRLEEAIRPKPFDWKWAVGIIIVLASSLISIVVAFQSRPTADQIVKMMAEHHDPQIQADVKSLQNENVNFRLQLDRISNKLDLLHDDVTDKNINSRRR